ncbi:MAG: tRNA lysidine(34) synthetase TilS [Oscillospiraceae bacterium]|jgi:tRNA(Ile)-lysidine synthase|nr:tRNA lysidine(34) synthetase TilS [Oscillospiraceae bacterium]
MNGEDSALLDRVAQTVREHALLLPGEKVLVAVSGGADSLALLGLLWSLREALGIAVEAAHFEHGIRGEASRADAAFVAAFCAERGIPCHVGAGDVPALAHDWHASLEDAARRARYAFFDQTLLRIGAQKLALAHQLEDQAETLLLHLVHGAGLAGLSAMRMQRGNRIRPLLDVPRADLEAYLRSKGIAWREDETNRDAAHARNLLRQRVFPLLRQLNPRVAEAMARTAAQAAIAQDALQQGAAQALAGRVKRLPYGAFCELGEAPLSAEALRAFADYAGLPPLSAVQTTLLAALPPGATANLPGGWRGLRTPQRLHLLSPAPQPAALNPADFLWEPPGEGYGDGICVQAFDADALKGAAFRFRQDGDTFAPLGAQGSRKLKAVLRDAGIDRPFRDLLPLLAIGSRVLWIVGLRPARDAAITENTLRRVQIRYTGALPWSINDKDGGCFDAQS